MIAPAAALAVALLAAASPFDLPPMPSPDDGYAALWEWLRTVNAELSLPDSEFRWKVGGFSLPILLVFELVGIRKTWRLYPFLVPFWLVFGGIALGVVGGLAITAAHLVVFPAGRIWFSVRDRRGGRRAEVHRPAPAPAPSPPPAAPPPAVRPAADVLRAALEAIRAAAEERGPAHPDARAPGRAPAPALGALVRAVGAALGAAARAPGPDRTPGRPPPSHAPGRPSTPVGPAAGGDVGARFRPDLSRFRRRPP